MLKPQQFGCKKCGSVMTVEARLSSDRLEFRLSEAKFAERSGSIELRCKDCGRTVATVEVSPL